MQEGVWESEGVGEGPRARVSESESALAQKRARESDVCVPTERKRALRAESSADSRVAAMATTAGGWQDYRNESAKQIGTAVDKRWPLHEKIVACGPACINVATKVKAALCQVHPACSSSDDTQDKNRWLWSLRNLMKRECW